MTHEQVKQTIAATLVRQKQQTVSAIESYLITASGGGGANYADVSRVITAVAYEAAEGLYEELKTNKRLSLVVNGMSIVIDSTSNGFDDAVNQGNPDAIAKAIAEGLIAGAAAYGVSIVLAAIVGSTSIITVGGIALTAYVLGNQVASLAGQGWEYLIGPNSDVTVNKNKNDITILSEGSINDILHHYWDGSIFESADKRMDDKATWIIGSLDSNEWAEKTGDNSYAFSNTLEDISRVGKEYDSGALFDLVKNYLDKEDIANGFYITTGDKTAAQLGKGVTYIKESKSSLQGLIQSDAKAQYAVWKLEPFVFENAYENLNLNLNEVSNNYISDRLDFYISYTNVINSAYYYYDVENGKHAGDSTYYSGDFPVDNAKIGFAENGNLIGSGYGDRLYGGSGNNTIYSDSDFEGQGADYIEGGLGSDTIYSGGKGDLIYTNINLDGGKVDNETSLTVNTVYAGDGGDRVYGSNGIDIIYADSDSAANPNEYDNKDLVEGRGGSDKIYGGDGRDTLYADSASSHADTSGDYIVGGLGADIIHGSDGNDTIYGDNEGDESSLISSDKDVIHGYGGSDTLYGGSDKDTLIGGMENGTDDGASDHLEGGEGFDTYVVNNGDTLYDSDGKGLVKFDNIDLTGTKEKVEDGKYKDDDYYYYCDDPKSKGTLTVTTLDGSRSITISDWSNENLGIKLVDNKDIEVSITESASASEGDSGKRSLYFTVTLSRALEDGESLDVSVSGTDEGSYTFTGGEQSKTFTYSWNGNTYIDLDRIVTLTPTASYDGLYDDVKVTVQNSGTATIYDDDEDKRHDPLALDINQDGFISTTDLDVSGTYFDITGDGLKERVGWIKSEDALLTYDKNENDNIDGIDEVFGNLSESGFEELKRLIDSNHDNVIDRRDELFNRLQVWNDLNQDAKVQDGELQSLKDAGITSIDLNYVSTNIEINGNLLTEASKYTDADGNKELAADIQLATDAKDTKLDLEDIPDFTIDPATELLPQLRGTGLVYDSLVLYNLNPEFKALAQEMSTNLPRIATEFDTFMEQYSGYTAYVNELGEKYSQDGFEMQELDKQAWIVERFEATDKYKKSIENYYNTSLSNGKIPTWAITNSTTVTLKYKALEETLESAFAIQSVYGDVFSDTHYDLATQSFVVNDQNNLETKIADYFNSDTHTIDEKLYLAKVMHLQQNSLEFDIDTILTSIDNNITRELARYVYTGEEATLFETKNSYATDGIIVTSDEDELISTTDKGNKIVLGAGDDKLISGKGNDKFYFRRGDGSDTIFDKGGVDILTFDNGITREDVEIRLNRNSDLVIAIKEDGKTFDEYSDKVTLVDWMKSSNRVERIEFGDGNTLKFQDVFELFEATDGVDAVQLSSRNDILNTKDGNDVIVALDGNDILIGGKGDDRLDGGLGNDTYVYGKGDGKDTIIDSGGYDAVQFTEGITADDLVVEYQGNDLLIGLKEDGKTFEELSDVITLKNYKNSASTIEAIYLDGYQSVDIDALLNAPTEFDDTLELSNNDQNIDLLAGDDTVTTGSGDDTVHGNSGNDTIKTGSGNDILAGDSGDDTLEGGLGDDTYIFNLGDGKDTIYDDYSYGYNNIQQDNAGNDTLVFGEGITADDIVIEYYGNDLMIGIKDGDKSFGELSDVITIQNYVNKNNKIENILLSDGVSIEIYNFNQGTNGADNISLSSESEDLSIAALNGIDFVSTGSGNDDIDGGSGDDDLYSGDGDDLLVGGIGDDLLVGGSGDDTYFFNRNDGSDVIFDDNRHTVVDTDGLGTLFGQANWLVSNTYASDEEQLDGGNDTIQFGEGIVQEDISFAKQANDLQVSIDNGGRILIKNYFNQYNIIENFLLADGTSVELPVLEEPVIPSTGDDTYTFNRSDESLIIFDQGGADTLSLGDGIAQDDIVGKQIGSDFIIGIKEDGKSFDELTNKIVIKNYTNNINRIETILFTDGTQIATESLKIATQEDDILSFGNESRTIDGLAGDDAITTGNGNDTIIGGAGNDTLNGGAGNDTYIFNRVDGKDIITYSYGNDTLKFAEGIVAEDLEARFVGSNLVIGIKEDGVAFEDWSDKVTIQSNFINNIVLNDSTLISLSSIITKPTEDNDNLNFAYLNEAVTVDGLAGDDNITTGNGNDTIIGGAGNDTLNGG
ncbi:hypothetical protein KKA17_00405, partial [bacterium]|nr:hypothetical protein [bacterium]MBU1882749.1 hypothetical protein [bacterium]